MAVLFNVFDLSIENDLWGSQLVGRCKGCDLERFVEAYKAMMQFEEYSELMPDPQDFQMNYKCVDGSGEKKIWCVPFIPDETREHYQVSSRAEVV